MEVNKLQMMSDKDEKRPDSDILNDSQILRTDILYNLNMLKFHLDALQEIVIGLPADKSSAKHYLMTNAWLIQKLEEIDEITSKLWEVPF